ncbi:MAG: DNA repair protein RecN [Firmicutes bacterium]|nr:DNA repair protein RecN [Bacillota bacterium]
MLELLHIENIAIIEAADIEFAPGFNALTGETGAGKSIVIDSLSAVLGQRTSRELIRTGAEKAFVSAAFSGTVPELTETLGIQPEADGTLLLQREIQTDGKNVCRVNGRPVTVGQLRALGARLLNIHGQHDGQQLLDEEQHIVYLDSFGRVETLAITYAEKYKDFTDIRRQIGALQMDEAEKARRVDTLQYQIEELRRAKLTPGEEEELTARRGMLRNAEKFLDAVAGADYALNGDDSGGGALSALRQAQDALGGVRHLDDAFGQLYERLGEAYSEVYDIAATVEDKRGELDVSPGELDRVESRMDLLYRLKKKYGATVEDMLDYQARCEAELAQIEDAGDTLARLEQALSKAEKEARQAAQALSDARKAAADRLTAQILTELQQLDMGKIRFAVDFAEKPLDSDGMDTVRFFGRAAQKVAEKMARISRRKQVLCVTHLPQLAAMADTHFSVEKGERGGRTYTEVRRLDREQRRQELARLTGGSHVSQTMLDGAEELLVQAEKFRAEL